ncbi:COG5377 Phage-related protein, predicted endonuclease [uncultured Caudovirales phage]|uniref:COG5377 Phage-related protein, predicted endonuclease n=1 Tax=uncultured Caudovirales phage TaxID=2100421 RepID=A0A6J7WVD5_9CAUD|nr:COG5377 Phage-related protein, predicted endonuclease [uncultured Caudovirales phage]
MMTVHDLVQGSPEWHAFRLEHFGASEAAAMLGISTKVKRSELLRMKHTGNAKEFSDWVQENILDRGHQVEAMCRPLIAERICEDLYPLTYSNGKQSASCDGITMGEEVAWEHKQWNAELAASVAAGVLPDEYIPQPQQIMMVTPAKKVIFTVSDGTLQNEVSMDVYPDPAWQARIRAGWEQFEKDLAEYVPPPIVVEAVGRTPETLPALHIEVTGMVTASNLAQFKAHALGVFKGINRELKTDQQFADADKTVKWCGDVEDRLKAAKQHALSQTASIDALFRTIDDIIETSRATRLELDKLVKARKEAVRDEILSEGKAALTKHLEALNARLGKPYMPMVTADFAGVIKGKRSIDSIRDAVSTELARAKISTNEIADMIQLNLATLRDLAADHKALFPDTAQLVLKPNDMVGLIVKQRIADHKAEIEAEAEKARERIAKEEQAKAEKAQADRERQERLNAEFEAQTRAQEALSAAKNKQLIHEVPAEPTPAPAANVVAMPARAPATAPVPATPPSLKLGQIAERLGFTLTADFLKQLGFEPAATDRASKLYHERDFTHICAALIQHVNSVQASQAA